MRNCAIRISNWDTTASLLSRAEARIPAARPQMSAPRRIALAASMPVLSPPDAMTTAEGQAARTSRIAVAVGIPQSRNAEAMAFSSQCSARSASTAAQLVPPAPATSSTVTPQARSRRASVADSPQPTSLTTTGTARARAMRSMDERTPVQSRSPPACTASCRGFKWIIKPLASIISTAWRA